MERLESYQALVRKYHATLDLMSSAALANLSGMVAQARAYADAIEAIAPAGEILDLGSGVGLPGVVIAASFPGRRVWLVERRRRRATFLKMVVGQLGLEEAVVIEADVTDVQLDDLQPAEPHSTASGGGGSGLRGSPAAGRDGAARPRIAVITAQAVASFADVYCLTRHLHGASVTLMSRKGPAWRDEVEALAAATGAAPAVVGEAAPLGGGTLVSIEARGGLPCPRSA